VEHSPGGQVRLAIPAHPASLLPGMADQPATPSRLRSLDALRGFDMMWIIGLAELIHQIAKVTKAGWLEAWAVQLDHVKWDGLRAYDLIFPLFMFLSGVAVPYALGKRRERGDSRGSLLASVWKRALILVLLGIIYNGGLKFEFETQRYASVLGQIGIAYGIAASIYLLTSTWRGRAIWCGGILVGIAGLQLLFPVPGHGAGVLTPDGIVNAWLDRMLLPGRLHVTGVFDPEGILCAFSAAALTLGGVLTGHHVRAAGAPSHTTAARLLVGGTGLFFAGWLCWKLGYPPIKSAWTTTFNLLAGGICVWLFTAFHLAIDFRPQSKWSFPLEVIGMNALTIYLVEKIVPMPAISGFFFGGIARLSGEWHEAVILAGILLIEWLLLWFLWKKRTFLRV
jgi:predicted acyltransferase